MDRRVVGVVGLGAMGGPIAGHLLAAEFEVSGFDIRQDAVDHWAAFGLKPEESVASLLASVTVLLTSLPTVSALEDVAEVVAGFVPTSKAGLIWVETSTFSPAAKIAARDAVAPNGVMMVDCPLSGTSRQLANKDVAVYASGDSQALLSVAPVLATFSRAIHNVGEFGNGATLKLISNLLVTLHTVAAAEALGLAAHSGIDVGLALTALTDGAGTSRMLEIRGPMMVDGEYEPPHARLDDFMKDLELISQAAVDAKMHLPLFEVAHSIYESARRAGYGPLDHAVVAKILADGGHAAASSD
jgi:putative dehydrogenase